MKKVSLFIIAAFIAVPIFAQDTIRGTYSYTYGDSESLVQAKQTCKDLAVRDAIESYYIFVESSTEVMNSTIKEDIINTLSAGYLKNLTVVDQTEEGRTLSVTVEAEVQPGEVEALVRKMAESSKTTPSEKDPASVSDTPEKSETLTSLLSRYDQKMALAEQDWNSKQYSSAFSQVQSLQKLLEKHIHVNAAPFWKRLYLCVHQRTVLIKRLILLEQAEQFTQRRLFIRTEAKQVAKQALQLKDAMQKLRSAEATTPGQATLRNTWLTRCQNTLDRVKARARVFKNRRGD